MANKFVFIVLLSIVTIWAILSFTDTSYAAYDESQWIPKSWSSGAHFTWVGKTTGSISITLNGNELTGDELKINNYDGSSHVRIPLIYAKSNIVKIWEGDRILYTGDIFFAPTYEPGLVPEEYESKQFHTEVNEEACLACHRLQPQESDMVPGNPEGKICFSCHNDKFIGLKFQHKAAGVDWECLKCHQAEAMETNFTYDGPVKFMIMQGNRVAPLCYQCHKEKEKDIYGWKYIHGPVAMGGCNICHNPHGSNFPKFLQKDISTVCIECHEMQQIMKKPVVHKPVSKDGCTFCHNPHGSNSPLLLAKEVKELCLQCHPKTERQKSNHPVTGHPVSGKKDPKKPQRPFSCVSCHNPHASDFDKMLPVEEVMMYCVFCHENSY